MTQEAVFPTNAPAQVRKASRKRRYALIAACLLLMILALLIYMGVLGGNVRVVEPGKVYRSGQLTGVGFQSEVARLSGAGLTDVLDAYKIRTVVNLRGEADDANWYHAEKAICDHRGVAHIDIPLSAIRMPPPASLNKLLATYDHAAYPLLYHCQAGADRSGLAGVLYVNIYKNVPLDEAELSQLTWHYGHLSWGRARAMNNFFNLYRRTSDGLPLRDWITKRYPALYDQLPAAEKTPGPDMAPPAAKK